MAASQSGWLANSRNKNGDSSGLIENANEKGDDVNPINQISIGQDLNLGIINQYGQLVGEYSKLDDELWLSKPDDDEADETWYSYGFGFAPPRENLFERQRPSEFNLEPLTENVDNAVNEGSMVPMEENTSSLNASSENQSLIPSPISVLKRKRSYSNITTTCSPTKHHQLTKESSSDSLQVVCTTLYTREESQAVQSDSEYSMESSLSDESEEYVPPKKARTKKISDLLDSNCSGRAVQKCMHCETTETPQWRTGPMGRKTLCNACGVQYKHGRLFADYRPLRSPTFDPSLHCSVPKRLQKVRMGYTSENSSNLAPKTKNGKEMKRCDYTIQKDSNPTVKPKKVNKKRMGYRFEIDLNVAPKPRKGHEMRMGNACERVVTTEEMRMINNSDMGQNQTSEPKRVEELIMGKDSDICQRVTSESKIVEDISSGNNNERGLDHVHGAEKFLNMRENACDGLDSSSHDRNQNVKSSLIQQRKQKVARMCAHCESTETPQWREGPLGRFTLCNACGVQYKQGRLFPEYRPLKSPTYDPLLHSHLPKKVMQMRLKMAEKCATSDNLENPA